MSKVLEFSTKRQEVPVKIDDENYVLMEASGLAVKEWRNAMSSGLEMVMDDDADSRKVSGIKPGDEETLLLSMCLYRRDEKGAMEGVSKVKIESWPERVIKPLYEKLKDISDLDEDNTIEGLEKQRDKLNKTIDKLKKKEETRKNSQKTTDAGSNSPKSSDTPGQ